MIITLIGSRQTPSNILREAEKLGIWVRESGYAGRSGHAPGMDQAAERGCGKSLVAFLPWRGFESSVPMLGVPVVVGPNVERDAMVHKYHPTPEKLSRGAFALMRRNSCQVLGLELNEPSNAVVCWTKSSGGTQQALRIAKAYGIPIFNLINKELSTAELVIKQLEKLCRSK